MVDIVVGLIIDVCFITDMVLCFFTAYEDKKKGFVVDHKSIAIEYFKSWFILDLMSK